MKIAIIGGGAAGFFAAINSMNYHPNSTVTIFEKSSKVLSKVKISGGGRCNVTNGCTSIKELTLAYPRGGKKLKNLFTVFSTKDTFNWFENRNVPLITQPDNCVFPKSQSSQSIIDCFLDECTRLAIAIKLGKGVIKIQSICEEQLKLHFVDDESDVFDKVIVTTGGAPKRKGLLWLEELGHEIENPVPSLFTFNMPSENITDLMGIVVEETMIRIQGTKLKSSGPLLITHWGMSGPAILKLSAFGARLLHEKKYDFKIQVNWVNIANNNLVMEELNQIAQAHPNKQLSTIRPFKLQNRLWLYLLKRANLPVDRKWNETGKKGFNRLVNILTNDLYAIFGKTTFKEEFVTCGGISLSSINMTTMQSKKVKNLYFAGELLDIDGITGGYNFQAAWTTAYIASKLK